MLKLLLLSIFVISCGVENEQTPPKTTKKDFGKYNIYVDSFIKIANQAGIDTQKLESNKLAAITSFEENQIEGLDKSAVGVCLSGDFNTIKIKKSFEERATISALKWILFHEMGHCIFNAKHSDDNESLMTPYLPLEIYLAENTSNLVEQKAEQFMQDFLENKIPIQPMAPLIINR